MITKKTLKVAVMLTSTFCVFACSKGESFLNEEIQEEALITPGNKTFVPATKATDIAAAFFDNIKGSLSTKSNIIPTSIEIIRDSKNNNDPMMYVMNYKGGGFVIVGATTNYYPILAYSEDANFVLSEDMGGVVVWLDETKEAIRQSETSEAETKFRMHNLWQKFDSKDNNISAIVQTKGPVEESAFQARISTLMNLPGGNTYTYYRLSTLYDIIPSMSYDWFCNMALNFMSPYEYTIVGIKEESIPSQVGPLLSTNWDYDYPFNTQSTLKCRAVAIAQMMKFHQHPTNYNWNNMPNTPSETTTQLLYGPVPPSTPGLMKDIQTRLNSYTLRNAEAARATLAYYGYNANVIDHNATTARNELFNNNRPVLMTGYTGVTLPGPIPTGNGHAWVCDGAIYTAVTEKFFIEFLTGGPGYYSYDSYNAASFYYPEVFHSYNYFYFHMNWGMPDELQGMTQDGWFVYNNVATSHGNYQNYRRDIYARPN